MSVFKDKLNGKASMMRRITLILIYTGVVWGTLELVAYCIFLKYGIEYDIHVALISIPFGAAITGKVAQKFAETKK